ncbi:MAG: hypothetical protein ABIR68_15405 [Ilumatobacteraceae bacterium]
MLPRHFVAYHHLAHPDWFDGVELVSNNRFDQDGLAAAHALVDPVLPRRTPRCWSTSPAPATSRRSPTAPQASRSR